ncbi:MAG: hypothetical protein R3B48_17340 [Kofleriaceae bacterium]
MRTSTCNDRLPGRSLPPLTLTLACLAALASASCLVTDDPTRGAASLDEVARPVEVAELRWGHSLLVRDPAALGRIAASVDFGVRLGDLNAWLLQRFPNVSAARKAWSAGRFVTEVFAHVNAEQAAHAAYTGLRLGAPVPADRAMSAVFRNWLPPAQLSAKTTAAALAGGPFRLLAVANRMDLAGDFDDRGSGPASSEPRALGEVHLIYGLVDRALETASTPRPFPMTFVLAYRLPPLHWDGGALKVDPSLTQRQVDRDPLLRRAKLVQWAGLWGELSALEVASPAFAQKLARLVGLAATPDNFLGLRSNTQISSAEYELRDWYILALSARLIHRKPREEPYRCAVGSPQLTELVRHFWRAADHDLDMRTRDPRYQMFVGKNGYSVLRDDLAFSRSVYATRPAQFGDCPTDRDLAAFSMFDPPNAAVPDERMNFVAPFGRATKAFKWYLASGSEPQRHAMAIRACTGCHGAEGAPLGGFGFHVAPRLGGEPSRISPFLAGGGAFTSNGITYQYGELAKRARWLSRFSKGDPGVLGDNLVRHDAL